MIERGIENHRKGLFALCVLDAQGKAVAGRTVLTSKKRLNLFAVQIWTALRIR